MLGTNPPARPTTASRADRERHALEELLVELVAVERRLRARGLDDEVEPLLAEARRRAHARLEAL
jgi:hypothetical protein